MKFTGKSPTPPQRSIYTWTVGDLLTALMVTGFGIYIFLLQHSNSNRAAEVLVSKGGTQIFSLLLDTDNRIDLNQFGVNMILEVKDGRVRVASSDCQQQFCVRHGWIEHPKEAIFCLPNHITVEVSGNSAEYDAISR